MFNWISSFNYDFAIATIPIQLILLIFYGVRRNLPVRQSSCFWLVMFSNLVMTSSDIISCEMNEVWMDYPLWTMYIINHIYFLAFIVRGWALFAYTAEASHGYNDENVKFGIITSLPAVFACILILLTPWMSTIYTFTEEGYHNCSLYGAIYFSTYFYIVLSLFLVIKTWRDLSRRIKVGLLSFNLILLFGILVRSQFYHVLVTSYFSLLAILIIYLTSENPDLYRDTRTRILNKNALDRIGRDFWDKKIPFSLITISINNYEVSKLVYGINQVNEELRVIAEFLTKSYPREYAFYIRNGNYILLLKGHLNQTNEYVVNDWKEKYEQVQRACAGIAPMKASMMLIPDTLIGSEGVLVSDMARYAINNSYAENRKENYIFSKQMLEGCKKQKAIEHAIKVAITDHKFEVYFQPIFSTAANKVMGAEALARLQDQELGYIPPIEFIRIAEKNGDIIEIGRQIFEKVCTFLERVDTKALGIEFINVNLSPIQCLNPNLVEDLTEIAKTHNIPMEIFDFEITESVIDDYEAIQSTIAGLRALGAELSLDDFGTGAANLTSLMNLPIHVVKIDMTFVRSYFSGKAKFLPDLIKLFKHSKMEIVVEGIETAEMMEKMAELGCEYEQGYFFSKPLAPDNFIRYMEQI